MEERTGSDTSEKELSEEKVRRIFVCRAKISEDACEMRLWSWSLKLVCDRKDGSSSVDKGRRSTGVESIRWHWVQLGHNQLIAELKEEVWTRLDAYEETKRLHHERHLASTSSRIPSMCLLASTYLHELANVLVTMASIERRQINGRLAASSTV